MRDVRPVLVFSIFALSLLTVVACRDKASKTKGGEDLQSEVAAKTPVARSETQSPKPEKSIVTTGLGAFQGRLAALDHTLGQTPAAASALFEELMGAASDADKMLALENLSALRLKTVEALGPDESDWCSKTEDGPVTCDRPRESTKRLRDSIKVLLNSGYRWEHVGEGTFVLATDKAWLVKRHAAMLPKEEVAFHYAKAQVDSLVTYNEGGCSGDDETIIARWEVAANEYATKRMQLGLYHAVIDFLTRCSCENGLSSGNDVACKPISKGLQKRYEDFASSSSTYAPSVKRFVKAMKKSKFRSKAIVKDAQHALSAMKP